MAAAGVFGGSKRFEVPQSLQSCMQEITEKKNPVGKTTSFSSPMNKTTNITFNKEKDGFHLKSE